MKIEELKDRFLTSIDLWADARIDDMVKGNPMMAVPSVYMKRAAHNVIAKNKEKWSKGIDDAALFVTDENGDVNADTIFDDMMQMLKSVQDFHFDVGFIHGHINDGIISIDMPDNILTAIFLGSKRSISITPDDFLELKTLITE